MIEQRFLSHNMYLCDPAYASTLDKSVEFFVFSCQELMVLAGVI